MMLRQMVGYRPAVGVRNYLIEGVSGTGKTSVCKELRRRGFHAINGDGILIDATAPLAQVVDEILRQAKVIDKADPA